MGAAGFFAMSKRGLAVLRHRNGLFADELIVTGLGPTFRRGTTRTSFNYSRGK